jgi:hypothetical protein
MGLWWRNRRSKRLSPLRSWVCFLLTHMRHMVASREAFDSIRLSCVIRNFVLSCKWEWLAHLGLHLLTYIQITCNVHRWSCAAIGCWISGCECRSVLAEEGWWDDALVNLEFDGTWSPQALFPGCKRRGCTRRDALLQDICLVKADRWLWAGEHVPFWALRCNL